MKPYNFKETRNIKDIIGLFDFEIPQYKETLPISLASYFYPEYFIPIFKLNHLQRMCEILGIKTNAKTKGEKLYAYNTRLLNKTRNLPESNYIKANVLYLVLYTVELYRGLKKGESYQSILTSYPETWKRKYVEQGRELLVEMNDMIKRELGIIKYHHK